MKVNGVKVEPEYVTAGSSASFILDAVLNRQISSGNLDVTVKYMGVSVFSKSGPLCDALACPLAEGPAELVFNEQMPSAAPPGSYTMSMQANDADGALFCVDIDFQVHWYGGPDIGAAVGGMLSNIISGGRKQGEVRAQE